jgi:hypothetical protein
MQSHPPTKRPRKANPNHPPAWQSEKAYPKNKRSINQSFQSILVVVIPVFASVDQAVWMYWERNVAQYDSIGMGETDCNRLACDMPAFQHRPSTRVSQCPIN